MFRFCANVHFQKSSIWKIFLNPNILRWWQQRRIIISNMVIHVMVKLVAERWYYRGTTDVKYYLYEFFMHHWRRNCTPISVMLQCACAAYQPVAFVTIFIICFSTIYQLYSPLQCYHVSNIIKLVLPSYVSPYSNSKKSSILMIFGNTYSKRKQFGVNRKRETMFK